MIPPEELTALEDRLAKANLIFVLRPDEGRRLLAALREAEDFRQRVAAAASLPLLSPSAPYEVRHQAIEEARRWQSGRWWDLYPRGQLAALAFRVWRALGSVVPDSPAKTIAWEEPGEELP